MTASTEPLPITPEQLDRLQTIADQLKTAILVYGPAAHAWNAAAEMHTDRWREIAAELGHEDDLAVYVLKSALEDVTAIAINLLEEMQAAWQNAQRLKTWVREPQHGPEPLITTPGGQS